MTKFIDGCAKNMLPIFWGAVVIGIFTFVWVLFNKGTLGIKANIGDEGDVDISRLERANPYEQTRGSGFQMVAGANPSLFAAVIPMAKQVVVNIAATASLPVGDPRVQQNQIAVRPRENEGGNRAGQNQNPIRQKEREGQGRTQNLATPPSGAFAFVDPFGGVATESVGSGIIIDSIGHILTNFHVIERATSVIVTTFVGGNKNRLRATIEKKDAQKDLAILKIEPQGNLPYAVLANSDLVQVGDPVIAIGSPFGLTQTVTQGIISAKRQSINIQGIRHANLFQTDASINKGNSGGPLFDINGAVIGINTAIFSTNGAFSGIGFAIPANQARELIADANITLPETMMAGNMGAAMNIAGMGQPAVFGFGKAPPIRCNAQLPHPYWGECINCHIFTDGPCNQQTRIPGNPPNSPRGQAAGFLNINGDRTVGMGSLSLNYIGLKIQGSNPIIARKLNMEPGLGVLVDFVAPNSPADLVALRPGDFILKIDGRWVKSPTLFHEMVHRKTVGESIRVLMVRNGKRMEKEIIVGPIPNNINQTMTPARAGQNANMGRMGRNRAPMGQNMAQIGLNLGEINWMGMELKLLTPAKAMKKRLPANEKGLLVEEVNNGPGKTAGLRRNDIIKSINNINITDSNSYMQAMEVAGKNQKNVLEIKRDGQKGLVVL